MYRLTSPCTSGGGTLRGPGRGRPKLLILLQGVGSNFFPAVQPLFHSGSTASGATAFPAVHPLFQRLIRFSSASTVFPAVHPLFQRFIRLRSSLSSGSMSAAVHPLKDHVIQRFIRLCLCSGSYAAVDPPQRPIRFYVPSGSSASPCSGFSAFLRQRARQ